MNLEVLMTTRSFLEQRVVYEEKGGEGHFRILVAELPSTHHHYQSR